MQTQLKKRKQHTKAITSSVKKNSTENKTFILKDNRTNQSPFQLAISMKGEGGAERSDGSLKSLRDEVEKTIKDKKPQDMINTKDQLMKSIASRKKEQTTHAKDTDKYKTEQHRIEEEEENLLPDLNSAYEADKAERKEKAAAVKAKQQKPDKNGFKTVGKSGKPK